MYANIPAVSLSDGALLDYGADPATWYQPVDQTGGQDFFA